jgi:hypothetical protein
MNAWNVMRARLSRAARRQMTSAAAGGVALLGRSGF